MGFLGRAALSARARQLIHKPDRTDAETAEAQRLLMAYMDNYRDAQERARRWRHRFDPLILRFDALVQHIAPLWEAATCVLRPVVALWNILVLVVHDLLKAAERRLRRDRHER